eukprot:1143273-Prorocentrum_minimum.AAC.4
MRITNVRLETSDEAYLKLCGCGTLRALLSALTFASHTILLILKPPPVFPFLGGLHYQPKTIPQWRVFFRFSKASARQQSVVETPDTIKRAPAISLGVAVDEVFWFEPGQFEPSLQTESRAGSRGGCWGQIGPFIILNVILDSSPDLTLI